MKYLALLCLVALIISCRNENAKGKTFTTDSLPTQQFTISSGRDTVLQTAKGALLKIPKGAITSENGSTVTLEIKEAYSIEEMIKGGLTTSANGEPLSSGGMIYINGTAGQQLKITQAIDVALPTDFFVEGMQLFKGDTSNGEMNWTDPKPLQETEQMKAIANGRQIFQQNCSTCHAIGKVLSGPDVAHFEKRIQMASEKDNHTSDMGMLVADHNFQRQYMSEELRAMIDSVSKDYSMQRRVYYHPNLYACNLIKMYSGAIGPLFPELKGEDWKAVYDYIQTESDRLNLPMPYQTYLIDCVDSCNLYNETVRNLNELKSMSLQERKKLIDNNSSMVNNQNFRNDTPDPLPPPPPTVFEDKVSPQNFGAQYYQFSIVTFGWYNIDILLKNMPGIEQSELFVRIQGEFRERTEIFLIIPSEKVNAQGGPTERNKDEYAFNTKDGQIPLPQNAKAYILAVTESDGKFAFALQDFNITRQQTITIELKEATKQEFASAMSVFAGQNIKIDVQDSKNANEIRAKDADLKKINEQLKQAEGLKPKGCDCDCKQIYVDL